MSKAMPVTPMPSTMKPTAVCKATRVRLPTGKSVTATPEHADDAGRTNRCHRQAGNAEHGRSAGKRGYLGQ